MYLIFIGIKCCMLLTKNVEQEQVDQKKKNKKNVKQVNNDKRSSREFEVQMIANNYVEEFCMYRRHRSMHTLAYFTQTHTLILLLMLMYDNNQL